MDGIQAWVALPRELEETDPAFSHHRAVRLDERLRLIAGEAFGAKSPVPVHSPLFYLHCDLGDGTAADLPDYTERAAYVASGSIEVDGQRFDAGQMVVFGIGAARIHGTGRATVMLLGGEPVGERFIEWNFVSSSRERIEQAKADWRAGRMKLPDLDNGEFIPLPEPAPPPNPMS
jgi:redox-sensitive bicupin YhaK (pirin superfamily)